MKTLQFSYNIGVNPGYGHRNEIRESLDLVGKIWQEEANKLYKQGDIYISGMVSPCKTVYHTDWGCPIGGEDTVCITGLLNPMFLEDKYKSSHPSFLPAQEILNKWQESVRTIAREVGKKLDQITGYLTFCVLDFEYFQLKE